MPHRFTTLAVNDMQIASPELSIATKDAGAGGIGSLILGGGEAYHTVRDNPANLDVANVQAHGDNTLALARHFGDAALDRQPTEPELVVFTVLPNTVLGYPSNWAVGLAVLTVVVFLALMIIGFRRRVLTGWGVTIGLGITVLSLPIALAVDVAAWLAVVAVNPAYRAPMGRGYYGATWNLAFLTCLTLATVFALHVLARRFLRPARDDLGVAAGALLVPLLLAGLTSSTFPAFSYVFAWPTLAGALLLGWRVLQPSITGRPWAYLTGLAVVMLITTVVVLNPVYLIYSAFAAPGSARLSPIYPVIGLVIVAVVAPVLLLHLHFLGGRRRWTVPVALVVLAAVFLGTELITTRFDADKPLPDFVQYTLNADTGEASWLSPGERPDAWTAQFFGDGYTTTTAAYSPDYYFEQQRPVITAAAPRINLPAPILTVVKNKQQADIKTVRLSVASPRGAPYAHLDLRLPGDLTEATVNGRPVNIADIPTNRRQRFTLLYFGLPREGAEVSLTIHGTGPITGTLVDYSNDLPKLPGMTVRPRPAEYIPAPVDFRDPTAVTRTVGLP
jgi:hypothetical protein